MTKCTKVRLQVSVLSLSPIFFFFFFFLFFFGGGGGWGVIEVCFGKMFKTFEQGASLSGTTRASLVNCQLLVLCPIAPLIHSRLVAVVGRSGWQIT